MAMYYSTAILIGIVTNIDIVCLFLRYSVRNSYIIVRKLFKAE